MEPPGITKPAGLKSTHNGQLENWRGGLQTCGVGVLRGAVDDGTLVRGARAVETARSRNLPSTIFPRIILPCRLPRIVDRRPRPGLLCHRS